MQIVNDYAGQGNDSQPYFEMANSAYSAYVGSANPDPIVPGAHYYTFDHGDVSFFVMDTRRYRSANEATDDEQKTMLGDEQKMHFVQWLADKNQTATWKFVVSSVPFLTNWAGPNGQFDTWGGFQTERTELMDIMEYVPK
jgi:alkaline phosphatase D